MRANVHFLESCPHWSAGVLTGNLMLNFSRKRPAHNPPVESHNRSIVIFCTICTGRRQDVVANDTTHRALREAWGMAALWRVGRYVIMPDHIHLFCGPATFPNHPLREWIKYWKRLAARRLEQSNLWQRDCWDRQLRTGESYTGKWQYVRENPVRAGLVATSDEWPYQGEIHQLRWDGE